MHRRSWQALGGKSLGSGRLRSFSVCSDPGAIIAECTARMRVKKKEKRDKLLVRETAAASGAFQDKFNGFVTPTDWPPC